MERHLEMAQPTKKRWKSAVLLFLFQGIWGGLVESQVDLTDECNEGKRFIKIHRSCQVKKKKGVVSQQRDSFRDRTLISFNAAGSFSSSSSCPLSTWNSRLSTFDSISDSQPKKWVTLLSKLKWKIEIGIVGGGILKSEYNQGYLNSWVVSHLALVISKLCHALGHELSLGDYKLFFEPKLNIYALCRDHCICCVNAPFTDK